MQVADPGRQPLGESPRAAPDLQHRVRGADAGVADDRVEQVGVGEEVLSEPPAAHQPNRRAAFASTVRSSSS